QGCFAGIDWDDPNVNTDDWTPSDPVFTTIKLGKLYVRDHEASEREDEIADVRRESLEVKYAAHLKQKPQSPATIRKFGVAYGQFSLWCQARGFTARPARPALVAGFFDDLLNEGADAVTIKIAASGIAFCARDGGLCKPLLSSACASSYS